jgi:hypothetical protein
MPYQYTTTPDIPQIYDNTAKHNMVKHGLRRLEACIQGAR